MLKETIYQMKNITDALPKRLDLRFHMCGTTYPNRNYAIHRPNSPLYCIEYIVSGTGHVQVNDTHFSPRAGDVYFLPQGSNHHFSSDRQEPWEKIWLNVSGDWINTVFRVFIISPRWIFRICYPNSNTTPHIPPPITPPKNALR